MSMRGYARYLGISVQAVSKAVNENRIVKGWDKKEKKIIVAAADSEFGFLHKQTEVSVNTSSRIDLADNASYPEAKRVNEILRAKLLQIEYDKETGLLIEKAEVNKQLAQFGIELRTALMSIAGRISADLFSSKSQSEMDTIVEDAIRQTLEDTINKHIIE